MEKKIEEALALAVHQLKREGQLELDSVPILVQRTPPKVNGDYATNLALVLAKSANHKPLDLAGKIAAKITEQNKDSVLAYDWLAKVEVAPPGFINFHCQQESILNIIARVLQQREKFGAASLPDEEQGKKILVEYVSANPTGPLHIGHGRAAAIGSALVNLMNFVGYDADGEFYVNDSGRQMNILAASFFVRLLWPSESSLPEGFYQGKYLMDLAHQWKEEEPDLLPLNELQLVKEELKPLLESSLGKEERLDRVIELLEDSLKNRFQRGKQFILKHMIGLIKQDLKHFRVQHTSWYYESETEQKMAAMIRDLTNRDLLYNKQGAVWFRSSRFGDDKDRVFQRSNDQLTYFAYDIGYHNDKYLRNYDRLIDILGADHHGYMNRIRASMEALGHKPFDIVLVQLVFLINEEKDRLSMSTRADKFVSLAELVKEFGVDVVRFFLLMHRSDQPLNFDMALAVSQTKDNPVYYVQYACARIASLFSEKGIKIGKKGDWQEEGQGQQRKALEQLNMLTDKQELNLATKLSQFPQLLVDIASNYDIHRLPLYLCELAREFHSYYNRVRILGEEAEGPRLCLCAAIRQTLANGLDLLGVEAPEKM